MSCLSRLLLVCFLFTNINRVKALPTRKRARLSLSILYQSSSETHLTFDDASRPKLVFKQDGSFKIMVLSDIHMGEDAWTKWGPEQDRKSVILLKQVLREENMDYV